MSRFSLLLRHLLAAGAAASVAGLVTLAALAALRPPASVLAAAAVLVVPSAIGAVCGAAVRGRTSAGPSSLPQDQLGMQAFLLVLQVAAPPSLAVLGLVPVLLARGAYLAGQDPVGPALTGGLVVAAVLPAIVLLARSGQAFSER